MKTFMLFIVSMLFAGVSAQQQQVSSLLEIVDVTTGERTVVKEFPFLIEAPNWTPDGRWVAERYTKYCRITRKSLN